MESVGASLRIIAELLFTLTARYFLLMFGVSWPEWAESILGMFLWVVCGTIIYASLR
jgi:hypothetical protein